MLRETIVVTYKTARRVVVAVVGASVVIIGLALLVLPGPRSSSFRRGWRFWGSSSLLRAAGS